MWPFDDLNVPLNIFDLIFNVLIAILIFRLRHRGEKDPMTLSQRWGLSLIAWLYIINSIVIFSYVLSKLKDPAVLGPWPSIIGDFGNVVNTMSFLALLAIGLVYPRPVSRWNRLRWILVFIAMLWTVLLVAQSYYDHHPESQFQLSGKLLEIVYLVTTYIPIFLWLREYERQSSPQMRMTLTILIWGYLLYHITSSVSYAFYSLHVHSPSEVNFTDMTLMAVVFILMIKDLRVRFGNWSLAERTNIFLMVFSLTLAFGYTALMIFQPEGYDLSGNVAYILFNHFKLQGSWALVRPALFSYVLLRYQVFGTEVKAGRSIILVGAIMGSSAVFLGIMTGLDVLGPLPRIGVALGLSIMMFMPFKWLSRWVATRMLPLSGEERKVSLPERRIIYLMSLQTAVVEGEVEDPFDIEVLKRLRRRLSISEREHGLLMAGFASEKPPELKEAIDEVYLFHKEGTMLGYLASKEMKAHEKGDLMATMFTAIREFSKDTLRTGADHPGAIEYGNVTLILEVEGDIALGVILRGKDNPNVRQRMRDVLGTVMKAYSDTIDVLVKGDIKDFRKAKSHAKELEALLRELMEG